MRKQIAEQLKRYNLDGIYVTNPVNIKYLTGFSGSFGIAIVEESGITLVTDQRYYHEALENCKENVVFDLNNREWEKVVHNMRHIAFEASHMTVERFENLSKKFHHTQWTASIPLIEQFRRRKNAFEITAIAQACSIGDQCVEKVIETIKEGDSEKTIALRLKKAALEAGVEDLSFPPIVAFEENSAVPHHTPSERPLKKGDTILIDFGVKYHGYCSDMTRTFFFQEVSDEKARIYNIVREAQKIGRNAINIGARCKDVYQEVVDFFVVQEVDKYFTHSLGHGVGIEIHEAPYLGSKSSEIIGEWETVTCEPGIYLPGKFGVRIEDLGVVKENGYNPFTKLSKELQIIG